MFEGIAFKMATLTVTQQRAIDKMTAVGEALPEGWTFVPNVVNLAWPGASGYDGHFLHPDGNSMLVRWAGEPQYKLQFGAGYAAVSKTIMVSTHRTAESIAADIKRKLLPEVTAYWERHLKAIENLEELP